MTRVWAIMTGLKLPLPSGRGPKNNKQQALAEKTKHTYFTHQGMPF